MRVYEIAEDGAFREYAHTLLQESHTEAILENWLDQNPDGILDDSALLVIGRQVVTNLESVIDLLGLDRHGATVCIELKRGRTPRQTVAQALEYASFVEQLTADQLEDLLRLYTGEPTLMLAEHHRAHFQLSVDDAVAFNKEQRLVIVGQRITREIRQTAEFLRSKGVHVSCVEFSFFQDAGGKRLISSDTVVGGPTTRNAVASSSLPQLDEQRFMEILDSYGAPVFREIFKYAREQAMHVQWGSKGFSLNVECDGTRVVLVLGYVPSAVYGQSVYTALYRPGGLVAKAGVDDISVQNLASEARATGLFTAAGRELKCVVDRRVSDREIAGLVAWIGKAVDSVRERGFSEGDSDGPQPSAETDTQQQHSADDAARRG